MHLLIMNDLITKIYKFLKIKSYFLLQEFNIYLETHVNKSFFILGYFMYNLKFYFYINYLKWQKRIVEYT